ncbi:MAG: hypothetical protein KKE20_05115 [Nanoarchaeota archaeon]|nr:hypothetical protein [Nanoarchaeota archaeon]
MLKNQKEWSDISKDMTKWIKEEGAIDIIVFGSFIREKSDANDIDLCVVIQDDAENRVMDMIDSLYKLLEKYALKFHINHLLEKNFVVGGDTLVKTMLSEGTSISKNKPVSEILGYSAKSIFTYSLKGFGASKRVRFHYLLRGRGGSKGILSELKGRIIGDGVITLPVSKEDILKEIFTKWDVKFDIRRVLFES